MSNPDLSPTSTPTTVLRPTIQSPTTRSIGTTPHFQCGRPPCRPHILVDGKFLSIGNPWRRRTSTFKAVINTADKKTVAVKDSFRCCERRSNGEEDLRHIPRDGEADVPGVVRLHCSEELKIVCGSEEKDDPRTRAGMSMLEAKTVNHLLMAAYDAL
ncbi:hypothetical protein LXA43DRAFT_1098398 [Ganoderma leucocontextum]|nr:hypothetical protein LXA43DRAFT_1098398 [Ganoderma leucocontextum]